jgi:hypothetical protein
VLTASVLNTLTVKRSDAIAIYGSLGFFGASGGTTLNFTLSTDSAAIAYVC